MSTAAAAAAPLFSMPLLREATLDDYAAIAALERAHGLKSRSREEWARFWVGNPAHRGTVPIGWVLEDETTGRVVGTLSNVPLPYTWNGRALLAATGRGWAVEPAFRAFAPLLLDEYINQNADVLLSTTVNGLAEASHTVREQTRVPVGDWSQAAFRVVRYGGFARVALRLKKVPEWLAPLAAAGLWIKDRLSGGSLPAQSGELTVRIATEFGPAFDAFWAELETAKRGKLLGVRSRAVLEWHFGARLAGGQARVVTAELDGRLCGYAVLARSDHPSSGLTRLRVADCQVLDPRAMAALIRKSVEVCRADGVHVLELVGCGLPALQAWEAVMPYRRALPAWCYFFHSNDERLMESLGDAAAWEPSSFDGDSSL